MIHDPEKDKLERELKAEKELNLLLTGTITHDLANPLTAINSYVDMLTTGRIPASDLNMTLEKIRQNTLHAYEIINNVRNGLKKS